VQVPVTAKLSKRFYDRFGDEIANEFVDWFNKVDATYRSDLKEINELNFARFDAKQEQRFAQFDAKQEQRFAQFDAKWEQRFGQFEGKWEQRLGHFEGMWERRFGELQVSLFDRLDRQSTQLTRLVVALWATLLIPIVGLWTR
jgi:hypothetical protein